MKEISVAEVLDMAMQGTTATLLARRWESALLVNVDNATLKRLMDSPEAMEALMNIEGFRSLNSDIVSQTVTSEMALEDGHPAAIAGDESSPEPWLNLQPGDKVIHKSMGEGVVIAIATPYIIVKFPDRESRFKYPDAFEKGYFISAVSHCAR